MFFLCRKRTASLLKCFESLGSCWLLRVLERVWKGLTPSCKCLGSLRVSERFWKLRMVLTVCLEVVESCRKPFASFWNCFESVLNVVERMCRWFDVF